VKWDREIVGDKIVGSEGESDGDECSDVGDSEDEGDDVMQSKLFLLRISWILLLTSN